MPKEIDKRNFTAFAGDASGFDKSVGPDNINLGPQIGINSWTGNIRTLKNTTPVFLPGSLVDRAIGFLKLQTNSFGLADAPPPDFTPEPTISETSTGLKTVNVQQVYKGIPVFLVNKAVVFNEEGGIEGTVGDSVTIQGDIDVEPKTDVLQAAAVAARLLLNDSEEEETTNGWGEPLPASFKPQGSFVPKKIVEFSHLPARPTVLDKSIFHENIRANLVLFYIGPECVLAWHITITVNEAGEQYDIVVSANDPQNIEVLYLKEISQHIVARGSVHRTNGGEPLQTIEFPLSRSEYPVPVNGASVTFKEWVIVDETSGVNVKAKSEETVKALKGIMNGQFLVFQPADSKEQQLLNIFYFCNFMHDFFFLLGFDEKTGSFDGNDPLVAVACNRVLPKTATMHTPVDGRSPEMRLGLIDSSGRHTALDADVVFHEYVHGVTKRLSGGRTNFNALTEAQSAAMAEGWSDYFALTIQNFNRANEKVVTGSWVKDSPAGVRSHPYNDDYARHRTYGDIGNVERVHERGEVWCAALMHWTRHLSAAIGKEQAYFICWQSVVDALKLTNANPTYLEGRDAILMAVEALERKGVIPASVAEATITQCWQSFATFGMGVDARSPTTSVIGIVEDFKTP